MIGKSISHYRILEKLGEGGMGVVYKAEDTRLERTVALKFLAPHVLSAEEERARFAREAKAEAALSHPNICTVFEIDEAGGGTFIAMEYVDGESLKDKIAAGPMAVDYVVDLACQIAEGLQHAHKRGIVHRDIKPANVVVASEGVAKIMDFGLAKPLGGAKLTRTGTSVGTVAYMSPEQARGADVDGRTDLWSLGVVMYEMLAGKLPFGGDYEQAVLYLVLNEDPKPLTEVRPDVPRELAAVVARAMAKERGARYRYASEMLADLGSLRRAAVAVGTGPAAAEERGPSIAVLPFANMSPDPENEYFGDGLAEEIINALTRIEGLRVAARTSAFRFRGGEEDIREIGARLNVTSVLEGSVRKAGKRIRVTAQLISVADGYHLWSDRYDRELEDIFAIQDEIATAIVGGLEIKLKLRRGGPLVKRYTDNIEAYSLFLKGRFHWNALTAAGWAKSKDLFEKAIEIDPAFAPAYAGLAVHYGSQGFWGDMSPREASRRALELAGRALSIDPELPDALGILGVIHTTFDWDWDTGERFIKRAIELDPSAAISRVNYGMMLMMHERPEEAMAQADLAVKLDPLSSVIGSWAGILPCYVGRYEDAVKHLEEVASLDPDYWHPYYFLSYSYLFGERFPEAVDAGRKAVHLSGGAQIAVSALAAAHYLNGERGEGDRLFDMLRERSERGYVHASFFASLHWVRGEPDEALGWIEGAIEERDNWLCWHRMTPPCMRLSDPRVESALRAAGL